MMAAFINRDLLEFASDQIAKIGIDAVKPLLKGLESPTPEVRLGSALSLGNMGSVAKEAAPGLAKLAFQDKVPLIRTEAKTAQTRVQSGIK
jgi:HEAT repeat protein